MDLTEIGGGCMVLCFDFFVFVFAVWRNERRGGGGRVSGLVGIRVCELVPMWLVMVMVMVMGLEVRRVLGAL